MLQEDSINRSLKSISDAMATKLKANSSVGLQVSVIVPCYNAENFIQPCLESLSAQTLPQDMFEVICVDDCSNDNTYSEIIKFEEKIKNLSVVRHDVNRKQGAARNTGIDASQGKYLFFIDADDFIRMDALETMLFKARDGADVVACQLMKVRYDKAFTPKPANRNLKESISRSTLQNHLGWFPVGMLIRRALISDENIRFKENVYFEDIEFCIRVFLKCNECNILRDYLYFYVQRDSSTVNSMTEKKISDSVGAMKSVFSLIQGDKEKLSYFTPTAISWLRLQAARIRDSDLLKEEKQRLLECYQSELSRERLASYIPKSEIDDLLKIPLGNPKEKASATSLGLKTCNSPWGEGLESEFSDRVIFFCEVDYHIRSAAPVIRELSRLGLQCILVDASRSTSFSTNRPLSEEELLQYSDIDIRSFNVARHLPFSTEALAFVFPNDLTYTSSLIFENFGFGVPTFGLYEGINDDWNLDRNSQRMPYRSVDHLLLPGVYQSSFYPDRNSTIVGLPNVHQILQKQYSPPNVRRAVINVNFTYGVLEEKRDLFVESAVAACEETGLDYVISQHPADKGDLSRYNLSDENVYELIEDSSILISRFSTTILEALAVGRPVVYHNSIEEKVPKFNDPLGAFSVSKDAEGLAASIEHELNFVAQGGDIRRRASLFLHAHCSPFGSLSPSTRAARAIFEIIHSKKDRLSFKRGAQMYESVGHNLPSRKAAKEPSFSSGKAYESLSDDALLFSAASYLLLEPISALKQLETGSLQGLVDNALNKVASNHPASIHFREVKNYALSKFKS